MDYGKSTLAHGAARFDQEDITMNDDEKELLKVGAETAMKPFADLINKLFGGPVEQIGGMWTDGLVARRQIRQLKLLKKVKGAVDKAEFDPRAVRDSVAVPLLQAALLEDEETLQDMWANLLANASDPRQLSPVEGLYVGILRELNTRDVKILNGLYNIAKLRAAPAWAVETITGVEFRRNDLLRLFGELGFSHFPNPLHISQGEADKHPDLIEADDRNFGYSMDVLTRNRLIEENFKSKGSETRDFATGVVTGTEFKIESVFGLTDLGVGFVEACQPPRKDV